MSAEFENAKTVLVDSLIVYLKEGDRIGKSQAELTAEFMGAFAEAAQKAQVAA